MKEINLYLDDNKLTLECSNFKTTDSEHLIKFIDLISKEKIKDIQKSNFDLLLVYKKYLVHIKNYSEVFKTEIFNTIKNKINIYNCKKYKKFKLQKENKYTRLKISLGVIFIPSLVILSSLVNLDKTDIVFDNNTSVVSNIDDYAESLIVYQEESIDIKPNRELLEDENINTQVINKPSINYKKYIESLKEFENKLLKATKIDIDSIVPSIDIEYKSRVLEDSKNKTKQYYGDIIEKYSKMYGIDSKIVLGIAMQESGIHSPIMDECGTIGLMKMQSKYLIGYKITAYNFETNSYETITADLNDLQNVETNIKIACMILQNKFKLYDYNILLAIQGYNMGQGNIRKVLNLYMTESNKELQEVINEKTNIEWINYREKIKAGDSHYLEHVFSWIGDSFQIELTKPDGTIVRLKVNSKVKEEENKKLNFGSKKIQLYK